MIIFASRNGTIFTSRLCEIYLFEVQENVEALIVSTDGSSPALSELILEGYFRVSDLLCIIIECPTDVLFDSYRDHSVVTP